MRPDRTADRAKNLADPGKFFSHRIIKIKPSEIGLLSRTEFSWSREEMHGLQWL
jgi:hypothetical protein